MTTWREVAEALYLAHPSHHPPLDCRPSPEDCRYCRAFKLYEDKADQAGRLGPHTGPLPASAAEVLLADCEKCGRPLGDHGPDPCVVAKQRSTPSSSDNAATTEERNRG
jgi:hypothetical protein